MDPDYISSISGGPFGPNIEEIRSVDGGVYHRITNPDGTVTMHEVQKPYTYTSPILTGDAVRSVWKTTTSTATTNGWSINDYDLFRNYYESEEYKDVDVYRIQSKKAGEHIVACGSEKDLVPENVLKTLSAIKGKLMVDVAPIHIQHLECSMTPLVRKNIIDASKRLKMYGKKRPIIARFDEYGNRLPDEIDLGTSQGITLKIIDPRDNGKYYMELKGIEFPNTEYYYHRDDSYYLPF